MTEKRNVPAPARPQGSAFGGLASKSQFSNATYKKPDIQRGVFGEGRVWALPEASRSSAEAPGLPHQASSALWSGGRTLRASSDPCPARAHLTKESDHPCNLGHVWPWQVYATSSKCQPLE